MTGSATPVFDEVTVKTRAMFPEYTEDMLATKPEREHLMNAALQAMGVEYEFEPTQNATVTAILNELLTSGVVYPDFPLFLTRAKFDGTDHPRTVLAKVAAYAVAARLLEEGGYDLQPRIRLRDKSLGRLMRQDAPKGRTPMNVVDTATG